MYQIYSDDEIIASQYNTTMDRLVDSAQKEKYLDEQKREAEITALAVILRYGINNSNGIVTIQEEYEWLKQYLLLQQTRLKDGFVSEVAIQPEAMQVKVHKLLMQPFVENAIIHGFEGVERKHVLKVNISLNEQDGLDRRPGRIIMRRESRYSGSMKRSRNTRLMISTTTGIISGQTLR